MSSVASARYCSRLPTSEPGTCSHSPLPAVCRRAIHDGVRPYARPVGGTGRARGIRTNLDCADICTTTGAVLSRHTGYDANITRALLEVCRLACASCGTECEAHADMHEHCRICAEACRRCEQACADLLGSLG